MAPGFDEGWPPYVPVAERRRQAARELEKLRKKGLPVAPVILEGRTIARTFWGRAWCDNLESYRDYENRLPRGRTYVRHGAVIDLQISALEIKAKVSGSSIYKVNVTIKALTPVLWRSICTDCAGGIDSLVELLQGRFSKGVMERICRQEGGLFPKPSDIRFSCTCPDGALLCKHVAAVLYGVGARLDERPELLFRLRAVDETGLVANLDTALPFASRPLDAGKVLETDDLSALFGLDMGEPDGTITAGGAAPAAPEPLVQTRRKRPGTKAERERAAGAPVAVAEPEGGTNRATSSLPRTPTPAKRISASRNAVGKVTKTNRSGELSEWASRLSGARKHPAKARDGRTTKKQKAPKPTPDLTPDGFVKWWK